MAPRCLPDSKSPRAFRQPQSRSRLTEIVIAQRAPRNIPGFEARKERHHRLVDQRTVTGSTRIVPEQMMVRLVDR
jgi:hypothetical protein